MHTHPKTRLVTRTALILAALAISAPTGFT
jgi:hypothetical protein